MFFPVRTFTTFAATLGLLVPCAQADTVGLHLASVHVPQRHFNNTNPGLYFRSDAGWTTGGYRNSLRRTSVYAGYSWEYSALALTAGAVTGYQDRLQALVVPSLRLFKHEGFSARLAFIPRVEKRIESNVWHLMIERCTC